MAIKLVVAVTDHEWFELLRQKPDLTEVNFWAPSGANFKALEEGELFLFKLHAPRNFIVGGGIFAYANTLPSSLAWEAFGEGKGARTLHEMRARIAKYRKTDPNDRSDFQIGVAAEDRVRNMSGPGRRWILMVNARRKTGTRLFASSRVQRARSSAEWQVNWCLKGIAESKTFTDAHAAAVLSSTGILSNWMVANAGKASGQANIDAQNALNAGAQAREGASARA